MNNISMAEAYLRQASERIRHAREALEHGNYPYVIRQCQEAVELLLKASLRLVGVEPPKWHDVGPVLKKEMERFPEWFRKEIPMLSRISRRLRRESENHPCTAMRRLARRPMSSTTKMTPLRLLSGLATC
ncbi:MAG: HEPN domain-containing protein [Fervidicoccaceae archaeon]